MFDVNVGMMSAFPDYQGSTATYHANRRWNEITILSFGRKHISDAPLVEDGYRYVVPEIMAELVDESV